VFITARFRSGSTLLCNLFRQVDACTAYYEPFNERRWFDPSVRGNRVDPTHRDVEDYWREYDALRRRVVVRRSRERHRASRRGMPSRRHGRVAVARGSGGICIGSEDRLLVPSSEALGTGGAPPLGANSVDHFKCYRVRSAPFRREGVTVETQFGPLTVDIKRPLHLCAPVDKNGEGLLNPITHLMCYQVRGPRPEVPESDHHAIEPYRVKKWDGQWQLLRLRTD